MTDVEVSMPRQPSVAPKRNIPSSAAQAYQQKSPKAADGDLLPRCQNDIAYHHTSKHRMPKPSAMTGVPHTAQRLFDPRKTIVIRSHLGRP